MAAGLVGLLPFDRSLSPFQDAKNALVGLRHVSHAKFVSHASRFADPKVTIASRSGCCVHTFASSEVVDALQNTDLLADYKKLLKSHRDGPI
ncbi:MAG: hypothetical protein CMO80_22560 [Verrucomicrobiales bacterium]|nr:hypothetical protein [Verrucomicrobiales bacterium]